MRYETRWSTAFAALSLSVVGAGQAAAQLAVGSVRGLVTGYASVTHSSRPSGDVPNDFTATLAPILLYQVGDDILFEAETDFELEEGSTEVHLEHAQIHYLGLEYLQFTAGMFHIPFGIWMHPNWINRMPTPPLLYQDTHGAPAEGALMTIPFDVGFAARARIPVIDGWTTSVVLWVSQGPASGIEVHGHGDGVVGGGAPPSDAPALGYGANFEDGPRRTSTTGNVSIRLVRQPMLLHAIAKRVT